MPTLARVAAAVLPDAVPPDEPDDARSVSWVRVMRARIPAFDALEAGDLVIVPERALATIVHEPADAVHVAEELARAEVAGAVLVVADDTSAAGDRTPQDDATATAAFLEGTRSQAIPTYRVAGGDETALERAVIRFLVNDRAEIDRQIGRLEATLQGIALAGRGIGEMAAAVAIFFHRAVAVEDADGRLVALFAPPEPVGSTVAAARYEARREPLALRAPIPGGGSLVLVGEAPPTELETAAAERVAVLVALEFARDVAVRRGRARVDDALPAAGPPWVVFMARQIVPGDESPPDAREERRRLVARLAPPRRLLLRGDAASVELRAVAAATADDPLGLDLARRVADVLGRPVAVSRRFDEATARPQADAEARTLLEAADEMAGLESPPSVLRADRLAMYRLLGSLHNLPDGERQARALLAPLHKGSPRRPEERLATLRALLDGSGPAQVAAILGVHRNTVAYRIRSMEAVTGWDLSDPDLRLALALALRIVQKGQN